MNSSESLPVGDVSKNWFDSCIAKLKNKKKIKILLES